MNTDRPIWYRAARCPNLDRYRIRKNIEWYLDKISSDGLTPEEAEEGLRAAIPVLEPLHTTTRMFQEELAAAIRQIRCDTDVPRQYATKNVKNPTATIVLKFLPNGVPWVDVVCRWCGKRIAGGCSQCVTHHQRLRAVLADEQTKSLRREIRTSQQARAVLADWYRDCIPDLVEE